MNHSTELPLIPAVTSVSGAYALTNEVGIEWRYVYDIHATGTRSESRSGRLSLEGAPLPPARPGDRLRTPWGEMRLLNTARERGWLLERALGAPNEPPSGSLLVIAEPLLDRAGVWKGACGEWWYTIRAHAMGTRSELRAGELSYRRSALAGEKQGDFVETPWGRPRWMGRIALENKTDYEQGFLLRGTGDRSLDELAGDPIFPDAQVELRFESSYLATAVKLMVDGPAAHGVVLELSQRNGDAEMKGRLMLDPNTCSLNAFGDREACTRIAVRSVDVEVVRQRLGDPKQLGRRVYEVRGEGLAGGLVLIMSPRMHRTYLKLESQIVPLFLSGDV
jgi:hypothetical protein